MSEGLLRQNNSQQLKERRERRAGLETRLKEIRKRREILTGKKATIRRRAHNTAISLTALTFAVVSYIGIRYFPKVIKGHTNPAYAQQLIDDSYQKCQSDDFFTSVEGCFEHHAYSIDFPNIEPQKY